eukprot:NODE_563_length_2101_cov_23.722710_g519_i0.p1 GENE.NODE_563_length_2101_cov_23.722710_g519_i0~~NODE_563_length_2101_cov_23.722710_g519_i0.p1  ORF type:complete len:649 (-),score=111.09 NODE_563_length_2101_cov_23.722710_g519_i0:155-1957(-)
MSRRSPTLSVRESRKLVEVELRDEPRNDVVEDGLRGCKLTQQEVEMVRVAYDENRTVGLNSFISIRTFLANLGQIMSDTELSEMLKQVNYMGESYLLPFESLVTLMELQKNKYLSLEISAQSDPAAVEAFAALGGGNDIRGFVDAQTIKQALETLHLKADIDGSLAKLEEAGVGQLDFETFCKLFSNSSPCSSPVCSPSSNHISFTGDFKDVHGSLRKAGTEMMGLHRARSGFMKVAKWKSCNSDKEPSEEDRIISESALLAGVFQRVAERKKQRKVLRRPASAPHRVASRIISSSSHQDVDALHTTESDSFNDGSNSPASSSLSNPLSFLRMNHLRKSIRGGAISRPVSAPVIRTPASWRSHGGGQMMAESGSFSKHSSETPLRKRRLQSTSAVPIHRSVKSTDEKQHAHAHTQAHARHRHQQFQLQEQPEDEAEQLHTPAMSLTLPETALSSPDPTSPDREPMLPAKAAANWHSPTGRFGATLILSDNPFDPPRTLHGHRVNGMSDEGMSFCHSNSSSGHYYSGSGGGGCGSSIGSLWDDSVLSSSPSYATLKSSYLRNCNVNYRSTMLHHNPKVAAVRGPAAAVVAAVAEDLPLKES